MFLSFCLHLHLITDMYMKCILYSSSLDSFYLDTRIFSCIYFNIILSCLWISHLQKWCNFPVWMYRSSQLLSSRKGDQNIERVCVFSTSARIQKHIGMKVISQRVFYSYTGCFFRGLFSLSHLFSFLLIHINSMNKFDIHTSKI